MCVCVCVYNQLLEFFSTNTLVSLKNLNVQITFKNTDLKWAYLQYIQTTKSLSHSEKIQHAVARIRRETRR
jgi:hypothetical protein